MCLPKGSGVMLSFMQFFIDLIGHAQQCFGEVFFLSLFFAEIKPVKKDVITHLGVIEDAGNMDLSCGVDRGLWADVSFEVVRSLAIEDGVLFFLKGQRG